MSESNLELQLGSTTPENIKSKESLHTLLTLYTDSLDELNEILESPIDVLDADYLLKKLEETGNLEYDDIRKELFKIHLQEIYATFQNIEDSEEIYSKFYQIYESLDIPTDDLKVVAKIDESINSQYMNASDSFKTKKGTRSGFFFVYDIINKSGIQSINTDPFFNLIEGTEDNPNQPYSYTVETSLYKEVFSRTVIPLAHPVGFKWNFIRLLLLGLVDYFGLEETVELTETILTCYGAEDGSISQQEIVNSGIYGTLRNFEISTDAEKNEQIIIDYNPLDGTDDKGLRVIRDYNNRIIIYDRQDTKEVSGETQYLEIEELRLVDTKNGFLNINYITRTFQGEDFTVVESVDFEEYTIIDREYVTVEFRIRGDKEDNWNTSILLLTNKVVSSEVKLFETESFDREAIIDSCLSYNGRIVESMGNNCQLNYKTVHTYTVTTKDIHAYIEERRPTTVNLPRSTDNIFINPGDIVVGEDPYKGLYGTHDHTMEETNFYKSWDVWGRLDLRNKYTQLYVGEEDLDPNDFTPVLAPYKKVDPDTGDITYIPEGEITDLIIGGNWPITDYAIHASDAGFNPNATVPRWENYYRPEAFEDLALVNSTTTIARYERDNLEWVDNRDANNQQYVAWEDFNMSYAPSDADNVYVDADLYILADGHPDQFTIGGLDETDNYLVIGDGYSLNDATDFEFGVYRHDGTEWILVADNNVSAA